MTKQPAKKTKKRKAAAARPARPAKKAAAPRSKSAKKTTASTRSKSAKKSTASKLAKKPTAKKSTAKRSKPAAAREKASARRSQTSKVAAKPKSSSSKARAKPPKASAPGPSPAAPGDLQAGAAQAASSTVTRSTAHGYDEVLRYHRDGRIAVEQRHVGGVLIDERAHCGGGGAPIGLESEFLFREGEGGDAWKKWPKFRDAEGTWRSAPAAEVPPWSSALPDRTFVGIHRTWTLAGAPRSISYLNHLRHGAVSRDPEVRWNSHPLVAAAAAGDGEAVEELLAGGRGFGLGHEPGAMMQAMLARQPALARRIAALPAGLSFAGSPASRRRRDPRIPEAAVYVPGSEGWALASAHAAGELPEELRLWRRGGDEGERLELELSRFEAGRLRYRARYRGADEGSPIAEEAWFDDGARPQRLRSLQHDDVYDEQEWRPSGELLVRVGTAAQALQEKVFGQGGKLRRVVAWDAAGTVRMELEVEEGRGRAFDLGGVELASGEVAAIAASGGQAGYLCGEWTLANGQRAAVDGFELDASELAAELLPLLARLRGELPPALASAESVAWDQLGSRHMVEPEQIVKLLWLVALDEPLGAGYGLSTLVPAIYDDQTLNEQAGPVVRLLLEVATRAQQPQVRAMIVEALAEVATRGYEDDAIDELKEAYRRRAGDSRKQLAGAFRDYDLEESYGEIFHALQAHRATIERWSEDEHDAALAQPACHLRSLIEEDGDDGDDGDADDE